MILKRLFSAHEFYVTVKLIQHFQNFTFRSNDLRNRHIFFIIY